MVYEGEGEGVSLSFIKSRVQIWHEVLLFQFLSTNQKIISSFSIRISIIIYNNLLLKQKKLKIL